MITQLNPGPKIINDKIVSDFSAALNIMHLMQSAYFSISDIFNCFEQRPSIARLHYLLFLMNLTFLKLFSITTINDYIPWNK